MTLLTTACGALAATPDVTIHFDIPEIEYAAGPLVGLVLILLAAAYIRRGRGPRQRLRRAIAAVVGLAIAVVAAYFIGRADAGTQRGALLAALALVALGWTPRTYSKTTATIRPWVQWMLVGLRLLVVALTLFLLARPVLRETRVRTQRPTLAVLLDDSRSMQIRDMAGGKEGALISRAEALTQALNAHWSRFRRLETPFNIVAYRFSETADRAGPLSDTPWSLEASGDLTDIAGTLSRMAEEAGTTESPLGAVLLLSDGAHNTTGTEAVRAAAQSLADGDVAVFAVGVGSSEPRGDSRSLVGRDLRAPDRVAVDATLPVNADFECVGFKKTRIDVQCLWDGKVVGSEIRTPRSSHETIHAAFEFVTPIAGFHTVEVRAEPRDRSWKEGPRILSQYVRVVDDRIRILQIEAQPRSEAAFIARALAGEKRFRLTTAILTRPPEGTWSNPLPRKQEGWRRFHVIIVGDVEERDLTTAQWDAIRDAVSDHGTGLALVGGLEHLERRSLAGTSLVDISPVALSDGRPVDGAIRAHPTPAGEDHPICRIVPGADVAAAWRRLPAMSGLTLLGTPKPAAEVLVADESERPLIVAATVGRGRCVAMAVDSTWRWVMQLDDGAEMHRRFWRQMVYWLANRRPDVHIAVDRPRYDLLRVRPGSDGVEVNGYVVDALSGLPMSSAHVAVTLTDPDHKTVALDMSARGDRWTGQVHPEQTGAYELRLVATADGREFGRAEARFVVESIDRERRQPLANLELLKTVAAVTTEQGGRYAELKDLPELLDALRSGDHRRRMTENVQTDIADDLRWEVLAIIGGLLAIEWVIRKRIGLV